MLKLQLNVFKHCTLADAPPQVIIHTIILISCKLIISVENKVLKILLY